MKVLPVSPIQLAPLTTDTHLNEPSLYEILMLNDDFTTMDFVIDVLIRFFHKSNQDAHRLMLEIHEKGSAICAICPREIAETRVAQVIKHARANDFPLMCVLRLH